ncbi:MAG: YcnI family protein [Microbacteriaceae bacterium]|nr:YcnI family protein [Microbacteriaceae bacterium]
MTTQHLYARARSGVLAGAVVAIAAGAALLVAAPASAHVGVSGDAVAGERATVAFRVPTESDSASTVSVTVHLPLDTPITSVRAQALPGWDFEVERVELDVPVVQGDVTIESAIASFTWTATGEGIRPDEYGIFDVQLGPIPDLPELALPTTQAYSDGEVVEWADLESEHEDGHAATAAEAEHPAPVLAIGQGADAEGSGSPSPLQIAFMVVAGTAIVVAGAAIAIAVNALRRRQAD